MKTSLVKTGITGFALILGGFAFAKTKEQPPKNVIAIEVARKTAIESLPGKVQKEKIEHEDGKWIYAFDLKSSSDSKIHEVEIDAISGKLLSTKAETDDEANEHEDETNETR